MTIAQGMRDFVDPVDGLAFAGGDPARGSAAAFAAFGGDAAPATVRAVVGAVGGLRVDRRRHGGDVGPFHDDRHDRPQPPFTGHYVTVWRKAADGAWKAIMDIGEPDAPPGPPPPPPPGR